MITTLTGSNRFLIDSALRQRLREFEEAYSDLAIERLDGADAEYAVIEGSINSLPFLSPKKLIVLNTPSLNKEFSARARALLENVSETNEVLIIEPSLDRRTDYFKLLKKQTDYLEFGEPGETELINWLAERADKKGGHINNQDARYLVELAGTGQIKLSNELDKLITHNKNITKRDIDLLVEPIPQTTIFQLVDASLKGDSKSLLKIYADQRRQKVEPQQIIAMLAWQLHILALIKSTKASPAEVAKQARLNPFVVNKSFSVAKSLSQADLGQIIDSVSEIDIKMKTQTIDADEAMKYLLVSVNEQVST